MWSAVMRNYPVPIHGAYAKLLPDWYCCICVQRAGAHGAGLYLNFYDMIIFHRVSPQPDQQILHHFTIGMPSALNPRVCSAV